MISNQFTPEFLRAWAYLFENEKGYVNDPDDGGGPTKYGITIGTLSVWRRTSVTAQDVENLTVEEAQEIYQTRYWELLACDRLPWSRAVCIFDSGVLYGTLIAAKLAQETANLYGASLIVDGVLGPVSAAAIAAIDERTFILGYYQSIVARVEALVAAKPVKSKYRKGWLARSERLLTLASQPESEKKS